MDVVEGIRNWIRSRNRRRPRPNPTEPLREFVYLDEVSVYSLLASRKSGVATQFTDSQTASLNSELGGSLKIGFGESAPQRTRRLNPDKLRPHR